jgi:hypothetical protein
VYYTVADVLYINRCSVHTVDGPCSTRLFISSGPSILNPMAKIGVQGTVLFTCALPTARHRISVRVALGKSFFREKRLGERRWGGGLERIRLALEPTVGTRRPLNCSRVHRFDHARPPKTEKKIRGRKRNQGIIVQTASIEIESNESGNSRHCRYITFGHLQ